MAAKKATKKAAKKTVSKDMCCECNCSNNSHASGGGLWFGGFIGAAIYYIATATSFWGGVLGVLKAIVWPVFLVYYLFKDLGL